MTLRSTVAKPRTDHHSTVYPHTPPPRILKKIRATRCNFRTYHWLGKHKKKNENADAGDALQFPRSLLINSVLISDVNLQEEWRNFKNIPDTAAPPEKCFKSAKTPRTVSFLTVVCHSSVPVQNITKKHDGRTASFKQNLSAVCVCEIFKNKTWPDRRLPEFSRGEFLKSNTIQV